MGENFKKFGSDQFIIYQKKWQKIPLFISDFSRVAKTLFSRVKHY